MLVIFFDLIKVFEDYENETFSIDGLLEVIFYDSSVYSQNHVLKGASTVKCDHVLHCGHVLKYETHNITKGQCSHQSHCF